jgi:hypothetical protein
MAGNAYDDLSFVMQSLDNTSTVTVVDGLLRAAWVGQGRIADDIDEAVAELTRAVVELQLNGDTTDYRPAGDRIRIHSSPEAFIGQFSVDARDEANRDVTILCYGRLPRADDEQSKFRGCALLESFLADHGIDFTPSTQRRYQFVCAELASLMEPGVRILGRRFRLPRLRMPADTAEGADQDQTIRLGPRTKTSLDGEVQPATPVVHLEPVDSEPDPAFLSAVDVCGPAESAVPPFEIALADDADVADQLEEPLHGALYSVGSEGNLGEPTAPVVASAAPAPAGLSSAGLSSANSAVAEPAAADDAMPGQPQYSVQMHDESYPSSDSELPDD